MCFSLLSFEKNFLFEGKSNVTSCNVNLPQRWKLLMMFQKILHLQAKVP